MLLEMARASASDAMAEPAHVKIENRNIKNRIATPLLSRSVRSGHYPLLSAICSADGTPFLFAVPPGE